MNIVQNIGEYLKDTGTAKVPGFGTFFLKPVPAKMDAETKTILPPAQEVGFQADYELLDKGLISFISEKENLSEEEISYQLKNLTDFWKNKLIEGEFSIDGLGKFLEVNGLSKFFGNRIESATPDFYGLEKIELSQINSQKSVKTTESYHRKNSAAWIVASLALLSGLLYLAYAQREMLFGKKSFENEPVKPKLQLPAVDSAAIKQKQADSLRIDSLKQDSIKKTTSKTWKSKKYYKKNKWSKAKQHKSH